MLKQAIVLSVLGMNMVQMVVPAEHNKQITKVVDNVKRKAYYVSCKAQKQKDCNMKSFNASIVYKFVGE